MHIGSNQQSGGRAGEAAAMGLSGSLKELGLGTGSAEDGNPARLLRRSIDFSKTEIQPGDEPVPYFTFWKDDLFHVEHSGGSPAVSQCSTWNILPRPMHTLPAPSSTASAANCPAISPIPPKPPPRSSAQISTNPRSTPESSKGSDPAIALDRG